MELKKLFNYGNSIYQLKERFNSLRRKNKNAKIKASTAAKIIAIGILCQNRSINEMEETINSVGSLKNIYVPREKEAKTHGLRDALIDTDYKQIRQINSEMLQTVKENKLFRKDTIDGLSVVAVDGVDEFETKKKIEGLPERKHTDGNISRYYKCLGVMHLGEQTEYMIRLEELKAKEAKKIEEEIEKTGKKNKEERIKAEGEITVLKRILPELKKDIGRNVDVVVSDALFSNVPVLNAVKENGFEIVSRFKDERREIYKDAEGMYRNREADKEYEEVEITTKTETRYSKGSHKKDKTKITKEIITREVNDGEIGVKKEIETKITQKKNSTKKITKTERIIKRVKVWSDKFDLEGYKYGKVRFIKYEERYKKDKKTLYVLTTLMTQKLETILKIMHRRWLIENNGFRVLKDRYNMDHCYVGEVNAIRLINEIIMLVFNLVNMYVDIRTREYREQGVTMRALKKIFEKQINENRTIYLLL